VSQAEWEKNRSEILRYLDTHGVVDKDVRSDPRTVRRQCRTEKSKAGRRLTVDLHRKTEAEAERILRDSVQRCRLDGIKEMLVIHGKGLHSRPGEYGTLKNMVRQMLENEFSPFIRDYHTASAGDGGEGATLAVLK